MRQRRSSSPVYGGGGSREHSERETVGGIPPSASCSLSLAFGTSPASGGGQVLPPLPTDEIGFALFAEGGDAFTVIGGASQLALVVALVIELLIEGRSPAAPD